MGHHLQLTALLFAFFSIVSTQSTNASKRGIAYFGTSHPADYNIFLSNSSPITWYYNWSPYPVRRPRGFSSLEFAPLIHSLRTIDDDIQRVRNLGDQHTHLLTFNEPDHTTDAGGTNIPPADAARAYHDKIVPLSLASGGNYKISYPSTTGTFAGLNWLKAFNQSCYTINATHGCHMDFIATHFYGDLPALASWLGTLNEWYNTNTSSKYGIWITEMALPQQDALATERMMNSTLPFLDALEYVEKYAWFGINRVGSANNWTGSGVSLLDDEGRLTSLGARYLNGNGNDSTFQAGMSIADEIVTRDAGDRMRGEIGLGIVVLGLAASLWSILM